MGLTALPLQPGIAPLDDLAGPEPIRKLPCSAQSLDGGPDLGFVAARPGERFERLRGPLGLAQVDEGHGAAIASSQAHGAEPVVGGQGGNGVEGCSIWNIKTVTAPVLLSLSHLTCSIWNTIDRANPDAEHIHNFSLRHASISHHNRE